MKQAFLEQFAAQVEPQNVIREATEGMLDGNNLSESLDRLDGLYCRAGFHEKARFGFFCMAVTKIAPLATCAMYRGVSSYDQLVKGVREYVSGTKSFQANPVISTEKELKHGGDMSNVKHLVRPDARVQNMETKMDTLADQLANFTLILRRGSSKRTVDRAGEIRDQYGGFEKGCSYCQKP